VKRRLCIVTGTRAEYGLLRWLMDGIRRSREFELQVVATGTHLSPEFGLTFRDIEADGFDIDRRVEMLVSSDTAVGLGKSMALGLSGFADAFDELRPDLIVVLGDRFEILSAVSAALVARIPVAHLHGGESSEGAFDESIRHAITKMSHLHFVAAEEYRKRVIQLGEQPDRVFHVGGLGIDNILRLQLLDRPELEQSLGFGLGKRNLLITFHPVTLESGAQERQLAELLAALDGLGETHLIFTMPNADIGSRALSAMVTEFTASHPNARTYTSLGQLRYLSCIRHVDGVIGNSSSGLVEAPTLRTGTVNIGNRQKGRLRAASVIDCEPERAAISAAIARLYSPAFRAMLTTVRNPYGEGGAAEKILAALCGQDFRVLLKKTFYDVEF
jgi:GDP/UDP-N,N'-diacetylbacillosamine 2-epimerase (hydrolysing)